MMFGGSMDGMVVGPAAVPLKYRLGVTGHTITPVLHGE
jgi:hypothetical protein